MEAVAEETNLSPNPSFTPLAQMCKPAVSTAPQPKPWFTVVEAKCEEPRRMWEPPKGGTSISPMDFPNVKDIVTQESKMVESAEQRAASLVAEAQNEADRILNEAREEVKQIREQSIAQAIEEALATGYQSGYQEGQEAGFQNGYEDGYSQASAQANEYLSAEFERERGFYRADIEAFLEYIEAERLKVWETMEPQMIQLTSDAVRHIIKVETEENKNLVVATVQNAMRRVAEGTTLRIRVNPADLETVRNYRTEILELLDGIKHLEINEDRRVGRGGCVLETEAGNIDARIETQMHIIPEILGQGTEGDE